MATTSHPAAIDEWAVVDVFCGVGGLSHGFRRTGFRVAAGVDVDESCRYAFETNNGGRFVGKPIEDVPATDLAALYPAKAKRILVGCAPCTPFSAYTPETKKRGTNRWRIVDTFAERIGSVAPEIVSMENVPRLASFDGGKLLEGFVGHLEKTYEVTSRIVACGDYGVPQRRQRLVVLASKLGRLELDPPAPSAATPTVRDAISDLPAVCRGEAHADDRLHVSPKLSELNLRRIRASSPGGTWHDWPKHLLTECHRRTTGKWYRNVYGRMAWDEPAPTITTGCFSFGRGRFGHPSQDRAITLREAALLQTFPPGYEFVAEGAPVYFQTVGRQIGNAVPVALSEAIARTIAKHIASYACRN